MSGVHGQQDLSGRDIALAGPKMRVRRGLRVTLASLATAILLTGVAAAGVYAYRTLGNGSAAVAGWLSPPRFSAPVLAGR